MDTTQPSSSDPLCPACSLPVRLHEPANVEHGEVLHLACAGAKPPVVEGVASDAHDARPAA
jgi:hypothetical protein